MDYIGVFRNIEKALSLYATTTGGDDEIIRSKEELIDELKSALSLANKFLNGNDIHLEKIILASAEEKLLLIEHAANIIVQDQEKKKKLLNIAGDVYSSYRSVLPDPAADDYYDQITAIRVISSRVHDVGLASIDVSQVRNDLENLLDRSIQADEYVIPQYKRLRDLSMLDADALRNFFAKLENKNLQAEILRAELEEKIKEMVKRNRKRAKFMERLNSLLKEYNSGAHDIDKLLSDLVDLAKDLNKEEQRAAKEGLSEDELAIFDLLVKENLSPEETDKVRATAKELLEKLKQKLTPGWRDFEPLRAGVKITINDVLYPKLPEPIYSEQDCEIKGHEVYNFVYENYHDMSTIIN